LKKADDNKTTFSISPLGFIYCCLSGNGV